MEKAVGSGLEKERPGENGFLKASVENGGASCNGSLQREGLNVNDALSYVNILRIRNKFAEALVIYNGILDKDKENSFSEAIRLDPQNVCALIHCGILYKDDSRLFDAAESYQKALTADPSYKPAAECLAIVLTDIGTSLKLAGNTQERIQKYYEALKVDPRYAPAYYNLGVVYSELMQYDTALTCYEKAALVRPMYAEAYCNMGVIYKNRGDLESAIACYERCLTVSPNFEIAKINMAIALTDLGTKVKLEGDIEQGVAYYKKALYYNWHYADAMYNLGVAYGEMLKFEMDIIVIGLTLKSGLSLDKKKRRSMEIVVLLYCIYFTFGVLYRDAGDISHAIEAYEQCLKIDPDCDAHGMRGSSMCFYIALLPFTYLRCEVLTVCYSATHCWVERGKANRLLAMNYINEGDDDKLYEAHRDWGRCFMRLYSQYTSRDNPKDPERPLIVGYVSPDFFTHSVSYFIEAPLAHHDYANYKVIIYSAVVKADAKTLRFREKVLKRGGIWRDIYGVDEKKVAQMVREDKVDILVELTGHTANNKLGTMACRPAPLQRFRIVCQAAERVWWFMTAGNKWTSMSSFSLSDWNFYLVIGYLFGCPNTTGLPTLVKLVVTWIGYPNTTGLPTIDCRITDNLADPPDTSQKHVEELVRLPNSFLCYSPSPEAGPISAAPVLGNGFVTFGSFNNLAKVFWAKILCAVPNSRLVVKCKPFCCDSIRHRFLSTLEQLGVEPARVDLLPLILLNHDHMQAYALMDISLDTFPYAGTTTTCESLYMGVPCVTMAGNVHAHNVGRLGNLVAESEDEYVQLAIQLATDMTALSNLRMTMRDLMAKSPVCNGANFTVGLEEIYRNIWRRYCKGDVPSLKFMEKLQQQQEAITQEASAVAVTVVTSKDGLPLKVNGHNSPLPPPTLSLAIAEENGAIS
ncbi:hypothetical protein RND81_05G008900 [Saponaria officinalis]|uniref:protein O-GlcNAc transferase n=1 Tax=Saponaria officinalis TaxID=3572 RepID=A0AAW1KQA2_SAPOF